MGVEHMHSGVLLKDEDGVLARAQGCLLGQLVGDSLGSLVEFESPEEVRSRYPHGVRDLADGGPFNLIAGQPTDDSEMALALARMLAGARCVLPGAGAQALRALAELRSLRLRERHTLRTHRKAGPCKPSQWCNDAREPTRHLRRAV